MCPPPRPGNRCGLRPCSSSWVPDRCPATCISHRSCTTHPRGSTLPRGRRRRSRRPRSERSGCTHSVTSPPGRSQARGWASVRGRVPAQGRSTCIDRRGCIAARPGSTAPRVPRWRSTHPRSGCSDAIRTGRCRGCSPRPVRVLGSDHRTSRTRTGCRGSSTGGRWDSSPRSRRSRAGNPRGSSARRPVPRATRPPTTRSSQEPASSSDLGPSSARHHGGTVIGLGTQPSATPCGMSSS